MRVPAGLPEITVAAGALVDDDGKLLITQRQPGSHMAGAWEFPGGKVSEGEMLLSALVRELNEELGIRARYLRHLARVSYQYPERIVQLHVWKVLDWEGQPVGMEGQPLRWIGCDELGTAGLLPANEPIIWALQRDSAVNRLGWQSIAAAVTG